VKAILIVIAAFQYDAGAAATTAIFDSMELCEQARVKLEQRHKQGTSKRRSVMVGGGYV